MKPLVSIIIPVYNAEKTINQTLESIIQQTYQNIEVIIVNDCSTDNSLKKIESYISRIKNLKIISNPINKMALFNRIEGVKKSSGELVTFLDADDWFTPNAIKLLVDNYLITNADMVLGSWKLTFDRFGFFTTRHWNVYYSRLIEGVYNKEKIEQKFGLSLFGKFGLPVINWARIYKKSIFDEVISINEFPLIIKSNDLYINLLIHDKLNSISFIKDMIVYYRYGGGSQKISMMYPLDIDEVYILRKKLLQNSSRKSEAFIYMMPELENSYFYFLIDCMYQNKFKINEVKDIFDSFKTNVSFLEMFDYQKNKNSKVIQLFTLLENNDLINANKIIKEEINSFKWKRGLKAIVSNILSKI